MFLLLLSLAVLCKQGSHYKVKGHWLTITEVSVVWSDSGFSHMVSLEMHAHWKTKNLFLVILTLPCLPSLSIGAYGEHSMDATDSQQHQRVRQLIFKSFSYLKRTSSRFPSILTTIWNRFKGSLTKCLNNVESWMENEKWNEETPSEVIVKTFVWI